MNTRSSLGDRLKLPVMKNEAEVPYDDCPRFQSAREKSSIRSNNYIFPLKINDKIGHGDRVKAIEEYEAKIESQSLKLARYKKQMKKLKCQLLDQSRYCTGLGLVLGSLAWSSSLHTPVVKNWTTKAGVRLDEFFGIANGTLVAFVSTYKDIEPQSVPDDEAGQFVISLLGIVSNVTACPEGRDQLIARESGRALVAKLVQLFPALSGRDKISYNIRKLILSILYNASMSPEGQSLLSNLKVASVLSACLDSDEVDNEVMVNTEDLRVLALRLVQSLSRTVSSLPEFHELLGACKSELIIGMSRAEDPETAAIAGEVMENLVRTDKVLREKFLAGKAAFGEVEKSALN